MATSLEDKLSKKSGTTASVKLAPDCWEALARFQPIGGGSIARSAAVDRQGEAHTVGILVGVEPLLGILPGS